MQAETYSFLSKSWRERFILLTAGRYNLIELFTSDSIPVGLYQCYRPLGLWHFSDLRIAFNFFLPQYKTVFFADLEPFQPKCWRISIGTLNLATYCCANE